MEKERVQEILDSPDMIRVTYKGTPVFIETVDQDAEKAYVFPTEEPDNRFSVEIKSLQEH
ncbi:small acid-soluble spore protein H (minor) [Evansella vedderi]|uniref:Small, acid-soluble spore protein H n=1 Tax=Evansella vedderi TaxID=38282 RepID=A0ABT9ZTI1_9BACI|nr:H-type small acid-soluble spore protein [Evansella vedderi]MDQ0253480.1 small acid-soluble spore protein H (minor) [Evansella vedderi]